MHAEHAVGGGVGQNLDEALGGAVHLSATIGGEGGLADAVGDPHLLKLLLSLADGSDFGRRIDHGGNHRVIHVAGFSRKDLSHRYAFLLRLVREHRPLDHIANGVDANNT